MSKRNWRMSDNSIDDSLDVILISLKGKKKKQKILITQSLLGTRRTKEIEFGLDCLLVAPWASSVSSSARRRSSTDERQLRITDLLSLYL